MVSLLKFVVITYRKFLICKFVTSIVKDGNLADGMVSLSNCVVIAYL